MASSSTSTLSPCERLPDELLRRVLKHVMRRWNALDSRRGAVRGVGRRWHAVHDGACQRLGLRDGVTDEVMRALCGRLPALTYLDLFEVTSLTAAGLRAVGGLTALTYLNLTSCSNVTDAVLWELRDLTALTTLYLNGCPDVTDAGLQHLTSLTALARLSLHGTSTTKAGQNALKAAVPALTI